MPDIARLPYGGLHCSASGGVRQREPHHMGWSRCVVVVTAPVKPRLMKGDPRLHIPEEPSDRHLLSLPSGYQWSLSL